MESFEGIYLDLSKQPGKCKIAESGLGWKPSGSGDTFTLDGTNIARAQWSRAARGYEVKILSRSLGVIQLDGFDQEVRALIRVVCPGSDLTMIGPGSRQ
jgi:structure-specific recognition protein 1